MRIPLILALFPALAAAPALADVTPRDEALHQAADVTPATESFVDAGAPRRGVRLGPAEGGRTRVRIEIPDGRAFAAEVDAYAVVGLAAGIEPEPVFATLQVTAVAPLFPEAGLWRVRGRPGEDGLAVAARLAPHLGGALRQASPDLYLPRTRHGMVDPPDDPRYPGQWFLARVDIEAAWALSDGDPAVTLVVIDSGCAVDHPDLAANMDPGYDAAGDDDDPRPLVGFPGDEHGTAVCGVAAAVTDNGVGVAGACPRCRLRCVRLLPEDGAPVPVSADVGAFAFAWRVGADVVNNSWGFRDPLPTPGPLRTAIARLVDRGRDGLGALVVFAAGNDARPLGDDELPALPGVVGVGATNNFDELTQFSNSGRAVDVVAPTGTLTTDLPGPAGGDPGDYVSLFGGTSSAAPLVAGVLGLMVAAAPDRTGADIQAALMQTAEQSPFARPGDDGHDVEYGFGVIRPALAIRALIGEPERDAGVPDAALPDVGRPEDAGAADAAADAEPGADATADPPVLGDGCGATPASRPSGGALAALALALLALGRRRAPARS